MIYTLTLNPAIDKTCEIQNFLAGEVNRIETIRVDAGGKGINVSKCLQRLGESSIAITLLGGESGKQLEKLIKDEDLSTIVLPISGQTRTNMKIVDLVKHQNTDINEKGPEISSMECKQIQDIIQNYVGEDAYLVLSGSIPRGVPSEIYRDIISYCNKKGVRVFLDADGECLRYGIEAGPYLVKPNISELSRLVGKDLTDINQIIDAAQMLLEKGIEKVVVSMGAEGALFIEKGRCVRALGLEVPVRSTVGAGDSMVAALVFGTKNQWPLEKQIRLAMAISAASVSCSGTQSPSKEMIDILKEKVKLEEV